MNNNSEDGVLVKAIFQNDEFERFRNVLSKYDKTKVDDFISSLNLVCTIKMSHHSKISKNMSSKDISNNRKRLLKKSIILHDEITNLLNKYSEYIEPEMPYLDFIKDEKGDVKSQFDFHISKLNYFDMIKDESLRLCDNLYKYISMMQILIGNESHCLSKGRKDTNRDRFYTQIAELFHICLAEPTKSKDGDFATIVGIVNELLGLREEGQDPSRAVNKAVDDLRSKLARLAEWSSEATIRAQKKS